MSYDPYQPPGAGTYLPPETAEGTRGSRAALFASVLLGVGVGSQVIEIAAWATLEPETYEAVQRVVSGVGSFTRLAGIVAFLFWIRRVVANVHNFGVQGLKHKPAGAVGFWFVPFVNLIHGYRVVSEVWKASDPKTVGASPYAWLSTDRRDGSGGLILHWWLAYMASRIAIVATRLGWSLPAWLIAVGVELVALTLLILVMRRVDERQSAYVDCLNTQRA